MNKREHSYTGQPKMSVEDEIQLKGLNKPRITLSDIEAKIEKTEYHQLTDVLTVCVLTLQNGFTVTGESTCASPENFDFELGTKIAKRNAIDKIWSLEGYLLKEKLYQESKINRSKGSIGGMSQYIGTKIVSAKPMSRLAYNDLRGWTVPEDENPEDEGYLVEYAVEKNNKQNLKYCKGYVSWSPKDVFEKHYSKVLIED